MKATQSVIIMASVVLLSATVSASPYPLAEILEKAAAEKLAKEKIETSDALLERGAKARALRALSKATKLPLSKLSGWIKMCDLLRIKGVGPEMVKLLNAGRITTVKKLRGQRAARLHKALEQANKKKKITENPPSEQQLGNWIDQAKKLKIVIR